MRLLSTILMGVFMVAMAAGSAQAKDKETVAVIHTDKGDIVFKFLPDAAPKSAENFEKLAKSGFYNGLTFHRVEPNFVIQGGDPKGNGMGGPTEADLKKAYGTIPDWVKQDRMGGFTIPAEIRAPHIDGAVAMARLGDQVNPTKASSASQFYICLGAQHFLDGGYTVFGQVVEGMDVARKIQRGDKMLSVTIKER